MKSLTWNFSFRPSAEFLDQHFSEVLGVLEVVLFGLGFFFWEMGQATWPKEFKAWGIVLLFLGILTVVFKLYLSICRGNRITQLEQTLSNKELDFKSLNGEKAKLRKDIQHLDALVGESLLDFQSALKGHLAIISDRVLNLTQADRITVYEHKDAYFYTLARYSMNKGIDVLGRKQYPDLKGVIGQAWESKALRIARHPVYDETNPQEYIDSLAIYEFSTEEVLALKMKSCFVAAFPLWNAWDEEFYGIIVVESLDEERFTTEDCESIVEKFQGNESLALARYLKRMQALRRDDDMMLLTGDEHGNG